MHHQPHRGDSHRDDTAGVGHQTRRAQLRPVLVFDFGEFDAFGTIPIRLVPGRSRCYGRRIAVRPEWKVPLDAALASILEAPLGSWLQARHGRTARLRIGEIEADVRNVQELARVIRVAKCYQDVLEGDT